MAKVLGQIIYQSNSLTLTLPTDGTVSEGDAVTWDGTGQLTPVAAAGDEVVGVATEHTTVSSAGDKAPICVHGLIMANVEGTVGYGDVLEPEGTNAGRLAANAQGGHHTVDEGGTAVYDLALDHPRAYSPAGGPVQGESADANAGLVYIS